MTAAIETTNALCHKITVRKGSERTDIKIKLDDDCRNGHEDFSLTSWVYENGRDDCGGCNHDHILALKPELQIFADLHLATWQGVPMHGVANGWYFLADYYQLPWVEYHGSSGGSAKTPEECLRIFQDVLMLDDSDVAKILEFAPRDQVELQFMLEELDMPSRWQSKANEAIALLEQWTGQKFESKATRGFWVPLTQEQKDEMNRKRAEGYYTPEAVQKRDADRLAKEKQKLVDKINEDLKNAIENISHKHGVKLFMAENFFGIKNWIHYDHTDTVSVNWTNTEKLVTKEQFEQMQAKFTELRPDIKLEWRDKPKY